MRASLIYLSISFVVCLFSCTTSTVSCFSISSVSAPVNTNINFDASCSKNASSFSWEFGDGTSVSNLTVSTTSHTYTNPGIYNVKLTVSRKDGVSSGDDLTVNTQTISIQ